MPTAIESNDKSACKSNENTIDRPAVPLNPNDEKITIDNSSRETPRKQVGDLRIIVNKTALPEKITYENTAATPTYEANVRKDNNLRRPSRSNKGQTARCDYIQEINY